MRDSRNPFVYSWGKVAVAAERKNPINNNTHVKEFRKWLPS